MPVKYNDKFIIPAPFASINKEQSRTDDGRLIGDKYSITLNGSFLSYFSGIYDSYNDNTKDPYVSDEALSLLMAKQKDLMDIFSEEGRKLDIIGIDSSGIRTFLPTNQSINFGEGNWAQLCEYSVSLESSTLLDENGDYVVPASGIPLADGYHLKTANDKYDFENNEDGTATVTRTITADGALVYDPDNLGQLLGGVYPWQQASGWCETQDDADIEIWYSGIIETILPNFVVIDTKNDIDVGQMAGNYSVERGWIVSNTGVYVLNKNSDETVESPKELNLDLGIQGLGFTAPVKHYHAKSFWDNGAGGYITDTGEKVSKITSYFSDVGADDGSWFFRSFGEADDREGGSINDSVGLFGHSGVYHVYSIDANTNWIDLPDQTIGINGTITGTGIETATKMNSALDFYANIDYPSLLEPVIQAEWGGSGDPYLQTQSLSLDHDTGEVGYSRDYVQYSGSFKDIWSVDHNMDVKGGTNDTVSVQGNIQGLSSDKTTRWVQVHNAFTTYFPDDQTVWNSKVTTVLGSKTPEAGYVTNRSFSYDDITGTIGYNYTWSASPSGATLDYSVDASYDRASDLWTVTLNGTARGQGVTSDERINSAMQIVPGESGAWQHAYYTLVDRLDDNSAAGDDPIITQLSQSAYMTSTSRNADEKEGIVTFSYSWQSAENAYINNYTTDYQWDDAAATETVTVNGTIKSIAGSGELQTGWDNVWKSGDPDCPESVYASRHQTYYADKTNITETMPSLAPISSTPIPGTAMSFNRSATVQSSSYSLDHRNDQVAYSITFLYGAWPYSLPLWLTEVTIGWTDNPSIYIWAQKPIIGKLTGPVHQNMTAKGQQSFDFSVTLGVSKRKQDQFGKYIGILLGEYTEYIMRQVFLERSGFDKFIYSNEDVNKNCYLTSDSFNYDVVAGNCSRSVKIVMIDFLK